MESLATLFDFNIAYDKSGATVKKMKPLSEKKIRLRLKQS